MFAGSPSSGWGHASFMRNVLIAAGNSGDASLDRGRAESAGRTPSPLVRAMAVWALARLAPSRLAALAPALCACEEDADVRREWAAAEASSSEARARDEKAEGHWTPDPRSTGKKAGLHEAFRVWSRRSRVDSARFGDLFDLIAGTVRNADKAAALAGDRIETFVFGPEREDPGLAKKPSPPMCC